MFTTLPLVRFLARRVRLAAAPTLCGIALVPTGCGTDEHVVARIDDDRITADDLRAFVEKLPAGLKSPYRDTAARHHYLQSLIDRRLMLLEAEARGLDSSLAVVSAIEDTRRSRLMALYQRHVIMPRIEIGEDEIRRAFIEQGYHRERKLNAILVRSRDEIEAVISQLGAGSTFEEVARKNSLDGRSSAQGGELGFVSMEVARRMHVPEDVFRDLPAGEVSTPLPAGTSWHVVRFPEERDADMSRYRQRIEQELFAERLGEAEAEELELLRQRYEVTVHEEGLRLIVEAYASRQTAGLDTSGVTIYSFDGQRITVQQAQRMLRHSVAPGTLVEPGGAAAALQRSVLRPHLFAHAAIEQEVIDRAAMMRQSQRHAADMVLEALRRQETDVVDVSDTEVSQFYADHPEKFVHERSVWAEELLLATAAEAQRARRQIEEGADFAEFVSQSLRADAEKRGARHHYHPRDVALYPRLVPALFEAESGVLTGPIEVDGGWSLFRLAHEDEGGIEPFDSARRRARALLLRQRQQDALGSFLRQLRDKYRDRVEIDEDLLIEALPDEVL